MSWIGRKTREWNRARKRLKPQFERAGITSCEFRFAGCWGDNYLGFAHARKRRYLQPGELEVVALACLPCHDQLEAMRPDLMYHVVMETINGRPVQPH